MIVKTENLSREFVRGKNQFYAVDHVNLEVEEKELVAIMGQSGSGKSTLFHMLTGILKPTEGKITVLDHEIEKMNDRQFGSAGRRPWVYHAGTKSSPESDGHGKYPAATFAGEKPETG